TMKDSASRCRGLVLMGLSSGSGVQWHADRSLQIRPRIVGGAECVSELAFGVEQRAPGIEHLERRRAAEAVAGQRNRIGTTSLRQKLVAQVLRLPECGRGRCVRGPNVLLHLGSEIAISSLELPLVVTRLRDLPPLVIPKEERDREADAAAVGDGV